MKLKRKPVSIDERLDAKIFRARLVLLWEQLWTAAFPLVCVIGVFALAAVSGVLELLPREAHFAVLGGFLIATGVALRPLFSLRMPDRDTALRRIEAVSGVPHQPATSYRDTIAGTPKDPASRTLWAAHKERLAKLILALKSGWPKSALATRDPYGLRYGLIMAIGAFFILNGGDWPDRIQRAVVPANKAKVALFMDAWIAPPAYTGKAPVFLARGSASRKSAEEIVPESFKVAANSELVIRLNGALTPVARVEASGSGQPPENSEHPFKSTDPTAVPDENNPGASELRLSLKRPQHVAVLEDGKVIASWNFTLIADNKPEIKISGLGQTADGTLRFSYEASDDYGVRDVTTSFSLPPSEKGSNSLAMNQKLFPPPNFAVDLPRVDPKKAEGQVFRDLSAHPWAGMKVEMRVTARDAGGQSADHEGAPELMTLPERVFTEPLARAIVEQRRALISNTDDAALVSRVLEGFTIYPKDMLKQSGVFLGLRMANRMLVRAEKGEHFRDVVDLLWDIALTVEDGNLSDAERELRKLRRELAKALSENAPPERIAELMNKMREAMNRYMREMAKQMQRNMREGKMDQFQPRPDQMISSQDLQKMMDQIEKLARSGNHDAA